MDKIIANNNLIKILDKEAAEVLYRSGFSYVKEKLNKKDIYVFVMSPELLKIISLKFSDTPIIMENKLRF